MIMPEIIEQSLFDYKLQETTCSIQEIRLPIFAPLKKVNPKSAIYNDFINNKRTRIVKTSWGEVQIKGFLLTQVHKDLLDLIVLNADDKTITEDNRLLIQFSATQVLKNYGDKGYNYKWFRVMLDELMGSVIYLNTNDRQGYAFHIISAMKYDDKKEFVGILLSSEYLKFYKENFAVNYNKETLNIINIESSILKSIVRFFLSHNSLNIKVDDLLEAIGIKTDKKDRFYRHIKQILKENAEVLESFNIEYKKNTFFIGGMTMSNSSLTSEQAMIVDCDFDNILLINAYAGTGKTSTLIRFCEKRAKYKILYLSYNSSMRVEAEAKFKHLKNVFVKTMHSLAYENADKKGIKDRLGSLRALDLKDFVSEMKESAKIFYARALLSLIKQFCNTGLDLKEFLVQFLQEPQKFGVNPQMDTTYIGDKIITLWQNEIPNNTRLAYEHDFYLKAFQLSKPDLEYDFILVDEAQDINGCVIDIVLSQQCKKVFIGDTYQSIYKFRGACNSLDILSEIDNAKVLYLTQSFRCPLSIASIANSYLKVLGAQKDFKGTSKEVSLDFEGKTNNQKTIITRTNAKLFDIAAQNLDKKLFLVGGVESYNFNDLLDIQNLLYKKKEFIKNEFIAKFNDVKELIAYSDESNEIDLKQKLLICFKYMQFNIFELIKQIKACVVKKQDNAELILSTGHKSKGLEWNKVEIIDDFISLKDMLENTEGDIEIPKEELNLFYVALTRSKNQLILNKSYLIDNTLLNECKRRIVVV